MSPILNYVRPYSTFNTLSLGENFLGDCSLFLIPASFLCGSVPVFLELVSDSCLGLRPSAATTDGYIPTVPVISSADLCNAFWGQHTPVSFLELAEEDCFERVFHPSGVASPAQMKLKQAGRLEGFFVCHVVLQVARTQRQRRL